MSIPTFDTAQAREATPVASGRLELDTAALEAAKRSLEKGAVTPSYGPWRLLSASALVATTFKTSELAGVVNALMQRKTSPRKDSP